jgi:hypothetical protein
VEISDTKLGAFDVDGQVDFAATGEVLDIAVSAVLGTSYSIINVTNSFKKIKRVYQE